MMPPIDTTHNPVRDIPIGALHTTAKPAQDAIAMTHQTGNCSHHVAAPPHNPETAVTPDTEPLTDPVRPLLILTKHQNDSSFQLTLGPSMDIWSSFLLFSFGSEHFKLL